MGKSGFLRRTRTVLELNFFLYLHLTNLTCFLDLHFQQGSLAADGFHSGYVKTLVLIPNGVRLEGSLIIDLVWMIALASLHARQVNRLFEAPIMVGSLLGDGDLEGKLGRRDDRRDHEFLYTYRGDYYIFFFLFGVYLLLLIVL